MSKNEENDITQSGPMAFGIIIGFIALIGFVFKGGLNRSSFRKTAKKKINTEKKNPDVGKSMAKEVINFKMVKPVDVIDVKTVRQKLGLSQEEFSNYFGFKLRTIQEWEQGRREPSGAIRNFLKVIEKNPSATQDALLKK